MTEAELVESIALFYDLTLTAIGLYITVCSGYLAAAYLIGSSLTKLQASIISALFCFVTGVTAYGVFGWSNRTFGYLDVLRSVGDSSLGGASGNPIVTDILTTVMVLGILACLKFMWDVRHAKTE